MADDQDRVRVAVSMLREDYESLKDMAAKEGESVSGYLRKALATEKYLKRRTENGGRILVEENGVQREVLFR